MSLFGRKKENSADPGDQTPRTPSPSSEASAPASAKKLPVFFSNFSEKQINLIYSVTDIKRLEPNEYLYKEGQKDPFLSFVLDGQVNVISSQIPIPHSFGPGSILSAKEFIENTPFETAVYADSPATVMILKKNALQMLDSDIIKSLYQEVIKQYASRSRQMEIDNAQKARKFAALAKSLYTAKTAGIYNYADSELIVNIIKKIPKLPAYTHTLSAKLLDENASSNEIVGLIRQDPALVADVLKAVNSSYYGLEQKVSDLNSAVLLLGFQSLYQLIMSEGIRKTMPDTPNFRQIHSHALALSYIAFSLSMSVKMGVPVQMATIGLLHNMGESVISLLDQKNPNLSVFINALDRPGLGAFLLEEWNFPKNISQTVKYQKFPEFSIPEAVPKGIEVPVALLYISQMGYKLMCGAKIEDMPLVYFDEYKKILKLDKLGIEEITRKYIISDLKKKESTLPTSLKNVLDSLT